MKKKRDIQRIEIHARPHKLKNNLNCSIIYAIDYKGH